MKSKLVIYAGFSASVGGFMRWVLLCVNVTLLSYSLFTCCVAMVTRPSLALVLQRCVWGRGAVIKVKELKKFTWEIMREVPRR